MESIFDAIIVGYGPVGQMMAILLGQKGYRVGRASDLQVAEELLSAVASMVR